jgi:hypothetical protein
MSEGQRMAGEEAVSTTSTRVLTVWAVLAIAVIMGALVAIVWKVVDSYDGNNSVAVLGVIIPMFVTIGAAALGFPVAYQRGAEQGRQAEQAATATKIDDAQAAGAQDAKAQLRPLVADAKDAVATLSSTVASAGTSPAGLRGMSFVAPDQEGALRETHVPSEMLTNAERAVAKLEGAVGVI